MLNAAYDDAAGVTARFNLNVLRAHEPRARRQFRPFVVPPSRVLQCREPPHRDASGKPEGQSVTVAGRTFAFAKGETIHTENSYKYTVESFRALARDAGWRPAATWTDEKDYFSMHALKL